MGREIAKTLEAKSRLGIDLSEINRADLVLFEDEELKFSNYQSSDYRAHANLTKLKKSKPSQQKCKRYLSPRRTCVDGGAEVGRITTWQPQIIEDIETALHGREISCLAPAANHWWSWNSTAHT